MVRATLNGLIADKSLSDVVRHALATLIAEVEDLRRTNLRQASRLRAISDDLQGAAAVQRDLLPTTIPSVRGLKIDTFYRPAGAVSGDLYDVCRIDASHVGFFVADATGHGVSAGLIAAFVKGAFRRSAAVAPYDPAAVLSEVNAEVLSANFSDCQFVTAVYGVYDEDHGSVRLSRAGAPHPLVVGDGRAQALASRGPMLGVDRAAPGDFGVIDVCLRAGQALIVHTDGIESLGPSADAWDMADARDLGRLLLSLDARLAVSGDGPLRDDVTVLALQPA